MKICIINGVNLNFTGIRQKDVYGSKTLDEINAEIGKKADELGVEVDFFTSNFEGEIVEKIQKCHLEKYDGIIINPGAFTHYSYALRDAISSVDVPCLECHMSNIHKREEFRHKSVTAPACIGQICGLGYQGYLISLEYFANYLK